MLQEIYKIPNLHELIRVVNQPFESEQEELITDLIKIVTVFSAKSNGKQKNKVQNFKKDLEDD